MKVKDYSKIMNLPPEERKARVQEEKEKVFTEGSQAAEVLSYLSEYFEKEILKHFVAFTNLPGGAKLEEFQTVWHSLHATLKVEADLKGRINQAIKSSKEVVKENEEDFVNI